MNKQKNVTVLLVDDDEVDVMSVERAFRRANLGNSLVVASTGAEALKKLRDGQSVPKPYLILLDLNMPVMGGLEFLQHARNDSHLKDSVIFVLTTSNSDKDRNAAYGHNIAGYIIKERREGGCLGAAELLEKYTSLVEFP